MKTRLLILLSIITVTWGNSSKEIYMDFDGKSKAHIKAYVGSLDTLSENPFKRGNNKSDHCAKYLRKASNQYDNIKIYTDTRLTDVAKYATNRGFPPKLTMKVFTSARPGTIVELQLGSSKDDTYPGGVHSQYQAAVTQTNKWEELTFNYLMTPKGSKVSAEEIDKIVILFAPGTRTGGMYFFDELQGPLQSSQSEPLTKAQN